VVRIDTIPPAAPRVSSSTNPDPKKIYHSSTLAFAWQSSDAGSGIAGYSYRLDTDPKGSARQELRIGGTSVTLVGLDTGIYYFHVRALDRAGNWGPNSTFPVRIDVTPPGLAHVHFNLFQFDPQFDALQVSFAVTRAATTVRMGVYRQSDQQLIRLYKLTHLSKGRTISIAWDGKDALGRLAQAGNYEIYIRAIDRFGHSSVAGWRDFVVDYRRIVVSLSQQKLVAYDGNRVLLTSLVTTGNRALPTPKGTFRILAKFSPFTFRSPWPQSSPYYYPPSQVQYAMLFQAGGYFIHDAPWRSAFGPGTNSQLGTPGNNYTGTHGCVNVPPDVAQRLFSWTHVGTVVQVVA
jgi:lipoprotein-anchoring transpeptidase ErfK/SrfK